MGDKKRRGGRRAKSLRFLNGTYIVANSRYSSKSEEKEGIYSLVRRTSALTDHPLVDNSHISSRRRLVSRNHQIETDQIPYTLL